MNKTFNGINCNICNKCYEYDKDAIVSGIFAVPEGWFMVLHGRYRRDAGPRLPFKECLLINIVRCAKRYKML